MRQEWHKKSWELIMCMSDELPLCLLMARAYMYQQNLQLRVGSLRQCLRGQSGERLCGQTAGSRCLLNWLIDHS